MDPELLGLTYIKGASTDSGIDTAPCAPATVLGPVHLAGSRSVIHSRAEQWADAADIPGPDGEQAKMYAVHGYAPAISAGGAADGSMGDLSEISSHSRSVCPGARGGPPGPAGGGEGREMGMARVGKVGCLSPVCLAV